MLSTTDAIVLSLQPHSDKAYMLHAYTRTGGRVNYMVYGLGRKNPRGQYSPFSLIQITADHTPNKPPIIKEVTPLLSHDESIYKQTIRLFICEILYHVLKHPMQDEPMFDFLAQAILELDQTNTPQNFHLQFLIDFAAKLGFAIPEESNPLSALRAPSSFTRKARQETLRFLCAYFEEHVDTWQPPKSLDILIEVFD